MKPTLMTSLVVIASLGVDARTASGQAVVPTNCVFNEDKLDAASNVNLVAVLHNAPRTKVTLSIDGSSGFHREIVWDPAVGDGLKHDVLLPKDTYTVLAYAEEDRVQTGAMVLTKSTQFKSCRDTEISPSVFVDLQQRLGAERDSASPERQKQIDEWIAALKKRADEVVRLQKEEEVKKSKEGAEKAANKNEKADKEKQVEKDEADSRKHTGCLDFVAGQSLLVSTQRTVVFTSSMHSDPKVDKGSPVIYDETRNAWRPKIRVSCEPEGALQLSNVPLAQKQIFAAAVARGFLDQAAPAVVTDTLAILAEIAVERAKAGAMQIVKERFVKPICDDVHLKLFGLGSASERAFPRTCALLENMRLQDLFASGRNLIDAARDDMRLTVVPRLVTKLDIPAAAQDIAMLALELGNKLIARDGNEAVAIDLLFTQLDRMFRRGAIGSFGAIHTEFIGGVFRAIKAHFGTDIEAYDRRKKQFLREVLQRVLPYDPGAWLSKHVEKTARESKIAETLKLEDVPACKRKKDDARYYIVADRAKCIDALIAHFVELKEWPGSDALFIDLYSVLPTSQLVNLAASIGAEVGLREFSSFPEWLESYASEVTKLADLRKKAVEPLLERSCAVRMTIAIVKWCSGRDSCTAADIATAIDKPETLFGPAAADNSASSNLENLCWNEVTGTVASTLRLPKVRAPYVELATRALGFLTPPPKNEERKRLQAMLRWTFDLAKTLDENRAPTIGKLEEILELFEKHDYVRAIAQALMLASEGRGCNAASCKHPPELQKTMALFGAVASYLQVYDETKNGDATEAKAARKKAIESLIENATDRRDRDGDWIFSLGSPVGFTWGSRWTPGTSDAGYTSARFKDAYEGERVLAPRVPLGVALQFMPPRGHYTGLHVAATFADLGNFLRTRDDIRWKDFVQIGGQIGLLFGNRKHSVVVGLDVSWSPGLFRREVVITGQAETATLEGALQAGFVLAYYVPFFDLN